MSIKAEYRDGVFAPLQEANDLAPGEVCHVFSDCELKRLVASVPWLMTSERSFDFWANEEDAVHDLGSE